jgi:hypothetical protein
MSLALVVFLLLFFLGASLRLFGILTKTHAACLASVVFSISLPATILVSLDRVTFAPTAWKLPLAACLISLPLLCCSWLLARLLHLPRPTQGGFLLAAGSINSVYFGYPVALAMFGQEGLARAILFDLGQTTLTLMVLYPLALWHGTVLSSARSVLPRMLSAPPIWALALILAVKTAGLHLPSWTLDVLTPVHLTTTPLASLVLGLSISLDSVRRTWPLSCLGVTVRMLGGVLLGWAAAVLLDLSGLDRTMVILISGMPSAVMAAIYAAETSLDEELVASIVALSICVGVVLLPWLPPLASLLMS